jgi:Zn-dependent protease with chaperone function
MHLGLFAIDVWVLILAASVLLWSWSMPALLRRALPFEPEVRARRLLGYALAPWAIAWLLATLAFVPTALASSGWISDWCLSRNGGLVAACPMHGSATEPDALAPMLALLSMLLGIVLLLRAGWLIRAAIGISTHLRLARRRGLSVACVRVDVVASAQPLAFSLCLPTPRVVVSEQVVQNLSAAELRALVEHEFAHLARGDGYRSLVVALASLILLPGARLALRRAWNLAVEQSCDRYAAERTDPLTLAEALLKFARLSAHSQASGSPLVIAFDQADFRARITQLLQPDPCPAIPRVRLRWWLALCLPLAFLLHELGEFVLLPLVR